MSCVSQNIISVHVVHIITNVCYSMYLELSGLLIFLAELSDRNRLPLLLLSDWLAIPATLCALGGTARFTVEGVLGADPGVVEPGRRGIPETERGVGIRLLLALRFRKAGEREIHAT